MAQLLLCGQCESFPGRLGASGPLWQRVWLIPVACLFLGNREAGTRTHFCGVLGLAKNWLN